MVDLVILKFGEKNQKSTDEGWRALMRVMSAGFALKPPCAATSASSRLRAEPPPLVVVTSPLGSGGREPVCCRAGARPCRCRPVAGGLRAAMGGRRGWGHGRCPRWASGHQRLGGRRIGGPTPLDKGRSGHRARAELRFPAHGRSGASAYSGVRDVSLRMGLRALIFPVLDIDFIIKWAFL